MCVCVCVRARARVCVPKENGMRSTMFSRAPGVQSCSAPADITRHAVD